MVLAVLAILGQQGAKYEKRVMAEAESDRAASIAMTAGSILKGALAIHTMDELRTVVSSMVGGDILTAAIYNRNGKLVAAGVNRGAPVVSHTLNTHSGPPGIPYEKDNGAMLAVQLPVENGASCQACHRSTVPVLGYLEISFARNSTIGGPVGSGQKVLIFIVVTAATLVLTLSLVTDRLIHRPLRALTETARNASQGKPVSAFPEYSYDEIGVLASELTVMLKSLQGQADAVEAEQFETMRKALKMSTIGELASALGHEIKNPMAGISGALQVFVEECPEDDPKHDVILEVQEEIMRLDRAFKDLLSFARSREPGPIQTTVGELLAPAVRLVANQAKKQNIHVNIKEPGFTAEIYADPEQVQQVFLGIMTSALHTMPDGGTIEIRVTTDESAWEVTVTFCDTGPGFSPYGSETAFDNSLPGGNERLNTWLGIARRLAENNGGSMTVGNRETGGAIYTVVLPLKGKNV